MTNSKSTKRALISSALAILMCVAMLVGATFAWFTDTASTAVNKIQAGNLNIELQMKDKDGNWVNAEGKTLPFLVKGEIPAEGTQILWEPGCTYQVPEMRILNNGNLAIKAYIYISGFKSNGGSGVDLRDVLEWETSMYDGILTFPNNDISVTKMRPNDDLKFNIKCHMKEDAGNEYQGLSVEGISITVVATQDTVENDSFNNQYDKDAPLDFVPVSTAAELKTVFANAAAGEDVNVSLTDDIDLGADNTLMIVDENSDIGDINIQANGHTVKNAVAGARVLQMAKSDAERTITITGAKIVSEGAVTSSENRGVQIFSVDNATVNLVNCDIEMKANDYSYPVKIGGTSKNTTVNITGCTLTGANCIESFGTNCTVNITDCVLNSNYAPNATYCGNGIQDKNGTNNTYNIKNTTFNGTNAQPWQTSSTTVINDLGGNVYNTTRTTH